MALVYCPNCRSANSSCERRCWICQRALVAPPANPTGRPLTYPQKMRLVRFEETVDGAAGGVASRIVYVKSVRDDNPVRDYWQAARDQQMLKLRRFYAGAAALLSVGLVSTLFGLTTPQPPQPSLQVATHPIPVIVRDNPLAHTILPPSPPAITTSYMPPPAQMPIAPGLDAPVLNQPDYAYPVSQGSSQAL